MGKCAWIMLIAAVAGDLLIPYLLALFYPGYSHKKMVMSVLGNTESPVRRYYNLWLVTLGVLLIASNTVIYRYFTADSSRMAAAVCVLVDLFAVGAGVLSGFFSVNQSKSVKTTASMIHGVGSAVGFMALLLVPLLISILFFMKRQYVAGVWCTVSFALAASFFVLFVMADKEQYAGTVISYEGLWQRLTLLFMYLPLAGMAIGQLAAGGV